MAAETGEYTSIYLEEENGPIVDWSAATADGDSSGDSSSETECTICLNSLDSVEDIRTTICNHTFHKQCIQNWLRYNVTCPICRDPLLPNIAGAPESMNDDNYELDYIPYRCVLGSIECCYIPNPPRGFLNIQLIFTFLFAWITIGYLKSWIIDQDSVDALDVVLFIINLGVLIYSVWMQIILRKNLRCVNCRPTSMDIFAV